MFSRRLPWSAPANRLSLLLEETRRRGAGLLDLTESNPTRVGLAYPEEAIALALSDRRAAAYDPRPRGADEARAAIAAHYQRQGLRADPDRILLTASTSEAYALLFKVFADPGDTVLAPRPSYPLFEFLAGLESVRIATYPLALDGGWSIDLPALGEAAGTVPPPRAIIAVNPNNPTGSAVGAAERGALLAMAARRGIPLISDEVFFDYPLAAGRSDEKPASLLRGLRETEAPPAPVFVLGGLSKSCGLPQLKLGWIVADGPADRVEAALARLEMAADTYLSVGTPVQIAAPRLLEIGAGIRAAILARVRSNRSVLAGAVAAAPACRLLPADGGWSAIVQVPAVPTEEDLVLRLLAEDHVLVHPGYFFDFPREAYLALSLLPEPAAFEEGVHRILRRLADI